MQKLKHILVLTILLFSCQSVKEASSSIDNVHTILELNRGACYGTCPIYSLSLLSDKKVKYHARKFMEPLGNFEWHLNEKEYNQIINLMEEEVLNGTIEHNLKAIDLPLTSLTYYHNNDTLQIKCKGSCPGVLKQKISEIETILFHRATWNNVE